MKFSICGRLSVITALVFGAFSNACASDGLAIYTGTVSSVSSVLFTNVQLSAVHSISAEMVGSAVGTSGFPAKTTPYFYSNDGQTLTVQFQVYLGNYTKCVKLELMQDGDDIVGRSVYAKYIPEDWYEYLGTNFDETGAAGTYQIGNVVLYAEDFAISWSDLYWNGASGDTWDDVTPNWLTAEGEATNWISGASAWFTNPTPQTVSVASGITARRLIMCGRKVTFTDGPLTLNGAGELAMRTGSVQFNCPIAGDCGLRIEEKGLYRRLKYLTDTNSLVLENASIHDVESLTGVAIGKWAGATTSEMKSYFLSNDGTTLTAQMQFIGGTPSYTKCVIIELTQVGGDIYGRITAAKYYPTASKDVRGYDFATGGTPTGIANDPNGEGYGLRDLCIHSRVILSADNTYTGFTRLEKGIDLQIREGTLESGNAQDIIQVNNGTLTFEKTRQKVTGRILDSGNVVIRGTVDPTGRKLTYDGTLPSSETVIFSNTDISGWVRADAKFTEASMTDKSGVQATPCYFRNDGQRVRVQFHCNDDPSKHYTKCAIYEFKQVGANVTCRRVSGHYCTGYQYLGFDFERDGKSSGDYTCKALEITVTNTTDTIVTFGGSNGHTGGTLVDGAFLGVTHKYGIPSIVGGSVIVTNAAKLFVDLGYQDVTDGVGNWSSIQLFEGSLLRFCQPQAIGIRKTLYASGGSEIQTERGTYCTHLDLRDSDFICTDHQTNNFDKIRIGYEPNEDGMTNAYWRVTGSRPVRIDSPLVLVRSRKQTTAPWIVEVENVTGDLDADLTLSGRIADYNQASLAGRTVLKTGTGTLTLSGNNTYVGPTVVAQGTLALGTNGTMKATNPLELAGGNLEAGGFTNELGTLTLSGDSVIALQPSSSLAFSDTSSVPWTNGTLTIVGELGKQTLRFGTSSTALTAEQLERICYDGKKVCLTSAGYLRPYLGGTLLFIR
ncbi:MAG: autotransporter-associated beta strand repeat-containing protein [Kiritimatiellae bacterium]|nr:autotransporter-associated beta strand repeat-containing protein [Kiritimatiellia bacterium]